METLVVHPVALVDQVVAEPLDVAREQGRKGPNREIVAHPVMDIMVVQAHLLRGGILLRVVVVLAHLVRIQMIHQLEESVVPQQ